MKEYMEISSSSKGSFLRLVSGLGCNGYNGKSSNVRIQFGKCYICKKGVEMANHFFLNCEVARELWNLIFSLMGCYWVMPATAKGLLGSWNGGKVQRDFKKIWRMIPLYFMWCIWRENNRRIFEGEKWLICNIKDNFLKTLYFGL
uniref:Reverse transcriptase zinc-binding domain-containing protein n=1 Tax=Davidia involucrata TaxID=16924 RepID=A0A5B7C333_DAVIN